MGGRIYRRIFPYGFQTKVEEQDRGLDQRLRDNMPQIIWMASYAFKTLLKKLDGKAGLEEVIPPWVAACRDDLKTQGNQFRKFLESSNDIVFGEHQVVPVDILRRAFLEWCQKNMVKADSLAFTDDTIEDGFSYAERRLMGPQNSLQILPKNARGQVWDLGYDQASSYKGISLRGMCPDRTPAAPHPPSPAGSPPPGDDEDRPPVRLGVPFF